MVNKGYIYIYLSLSLSAALLSLSYSSPTRAALVRACWPARGRALPLTIARSPSPVLPHHPTARASSRVTCALTLSLPWYYATLLFLYPPLSLSVSCAVVGARGTLYFAAGSTGRAPRCVLSIPLPCVARSPLVCVLSLPSSAYFARACSTVAARPGGASVDR